LKQHNFIIFGCISVKLDNKVCVIVEQLFLQNSVQKLACTAEMSTEVAGGYCFIFPCM